MNTFFRTTALAWCSTFVLVAASVPANAANGAEATPARVTFDGQIRNNSLALSPDEATAVSDVVFLLKLQSYWQWVMSGFILMLVVILTALTESRTSPGSSG